MALFVMEPFCAEPFLTMHSLMDGSKVIALVWLPVASFLSVPDKNRSWSLHEQQMTTYNGSPFKRVMLGKAHETYSKAANKVRKKGWVKREI